MVRRKSAKEIDVDLPERFLWAADLLDIKPEDNILEIGCGAGLLAEVIGKKLVKGEFVGVDRSSPMIGKAEKRNGDLIACGTSSFIASDFADAKLPTAHFNRVVAFNVNFFWKDPSKELKLIRRCLKNNGQLFVFSQAPYEIDGKVADPIRAKLVEYNFMVKDIVVKKLRPTSAFCVIAEPELSKL